MRVLFVCELERGNLYIDNLVNGLNKVGVNVDVGVHLFWKSSEDYDIIHIQWPEILFSWKDPSDYEVRELRAVLEKCRGKSKIVVTRHNFIPHQGKRSVWEVVYDLVYTYSDAIIHFDKFSLLTFIKKFKNAKNVVIEHPKYEDVRSNLYNLKSVVDKYRLPINKEIIVVPGAIRNLKEELLLIKTARKFENRGVFFICPSYKKSAAPPKKHFFKYLDWFLWVRNKLPANLLYFASFIPYSDLVSLVKLSNLVLIIREDVLNSGNLYLGYSLGKVVVGPECGNIGSILSKNNNPVYSFKSVDSLKEAILKGMKLEKEGVGGLNKEYADNHLNILHISQKHVELYNLL